MQQLNLDMGNHIFITATPAIIQITRPLFEFLPINYFRFYRLYRDGSYIRLSTNAEWTYHYMMKKYALSASPHNIFDAGESGFSLFDLSEKSQLISEPLIDAREYFGLAHGFSMQEVYDGYTDIYDLTSFPEEERINELYLQYLSSIKKFTKYFKLVAQEIIKKAEVDKFMLPILGNSSLNYPLKEKKKEFDKKIDLISLIASNGKNDICFTERETECLQGMIKGKTSKMLARDLGLSVRTIEYYMNTIKIKMGCSYKVDILKILNERIDMENI